ncbi:MAG: histidine triad nucleotide-binding protein [Clostridiales bacterium]|nr:histidine triad nucleotide-binding protein [Clostridiales bacterium]
MSDCIFCKIVQGEIPSKIHYEDDNVMAFEDINSQSPIHLLIIPKKHIPSMVDVTEEDRKEIIPEIFKAIQKLSEELNFNNEGYRIVNNCGDHGGQTVKHLHFHLLAGRQMTWPPG